MVSTGLAHGGCGTSGGSTTIAATRPEWFQSLETSGPAGFPVMN
jgi:hypothetical protein